MFPIKQFSSVVTLYTLYRDSETDEVTYIRTVLWRCFWNQNSVAVRQRGGVATPDQVTLHVPLFTNHYYTPRAAFHRLPRDELGKRWTITGGVDEEATVILPFECDITFPWAIQSAVNYAMKNLRSEYGDTVHYAREVNEHLQCDRQLQRLVVVC